MGVLEPLEPRRMLAGDTPGALDSGFGMDFGHEDPNGMPDGVPDGLFTKAFEPDDGVAPRNEFFEAVGQQADGRLIFAGSSKVVDSDIIVARLNTDGSLDTSFGNDGDGFVRINIGPLPIHQEVHDLAIDGLDRIVVAGFTGNLTNGSLNQAYAVRLTPDGDHDLGFDSNPSDGVGGFSTVPLTSHASAESVTIDGSGRVVIAGTVGVSSGRDFFAARFDTDGRLDASFSSDGFVVTDIDQRHDEATSVAIDPLGRILVAGRVSVTIGSVVDTRMGVARYLADGTPDASFGAAGQDILAVNVATVSATDFGLTTEDVFASSVAAQPNGQIVLAGVIQLSGNLNDLAVARLNVDGTLDATSADGTDPGFGEIQLDGTRNGTHSINLGVRDAITSPLRNGPSIALEPPDPNGDVKIVIGSTIFCDFATQLNNCPTEARDQQFLLVRLAKEGDLDTSFQDGGGTVTDFLPQTAGGDAWHQLTDVIVQGDGRVVAGGGIWFVADPSAPGTTDFQLAAARYLSDLGIAPVANTGNPYQVPAGGSIQLDGSGSVQPEDGINGNETLVFEWDLDGDGILGEVNTLGDTPAARGDEKGVAPIFQAVELDGAAQVPIRLRVTNARGLWDFDFGTIEIVQNAPPVLTVDNATVSIDEGMTAQSSGSFSDADGDVVALSASVGTVLENSDGTWSWSLDANDGPAESQLVTITATDGELETAVSFDLVVVNVAPTADAGGPYSTVPDETITLDATASTDPAGAADPLTYAWDFDGDGLFDDATGATPEYDPALFGIAPGGTGVVAVRVSDDDAGASVATTTVNVAGPGVFLSNRILVAIGSTGADSLNIGLAGGQVVVTSALVPGGSASFNPADLDLITINVGDGDDMVTIPSSFPIDVQLDGGAGSDLLMTGGGNDFVVGGSGNDLVLTQSGDDIVLGGDGADFLFTGADNDVILGGGGADQLFGGTGFDLVIGGTESDWLWGGAGEDILIGSSTIYDDYDNPANADAIDQIMAVWTSTDKTYDQRVGMLTASGGLLDPAEAIFNDDSTDVYIGSGGNDLYFADLGSSGNEDVLPFVSVREEAFLV